MSRLLPILLGVTITILVRCESPAPWPTSGVFVGYYAFGFERSDFKPAGTAERWWLSGNISTLKQEKGRNPAYVVIRGTLSAEGRHGHLGITAESSESTRSLMSGRFSPMRELRSNSQCSGPGLALLAVAADRDR